ncbi:glycoside hydrolase family 88/105 protein [Pedobacter borealis]|uniref:glycoside hydrolase family 88/105 protein n=1 Tax=Pedobacter borealis TaxID=475254 RepID=UPI00068961DB|nr:glycoside hydrolase family 88 protein [Pedobacter borealis]
MLTKKNILIIFALLTVTNAFARKPHDFSTNHLNNNAWCWFLHPQAINGEIKQPSADLTKQAINDIMNRVAHWQMKETEGKETADWTFGALYAGMVEYAKSTNDTTCFNWLKSVGAKLKWTQKLEADPSLRYHADDYAVGMMYAEMFRVFKDKKMYSPMERYFDFILKHPSKRNLKHTFEPGNYCTERWSWCDALFMGPTVWAKMANITGKKEYLKFMDKEYRFTYRYLYSKENDLFFRDDSFFDKKEKNGQPVFWGRGNGWVLAGLPIIIQELPSNFKNRKFYERLFVEMAEKIAGLQDEKGFWHASLLDPDSYPNPEMSCTGFYTYALAWGINHGYLNKAKYQPIVEKGWQSMVKSVFPNGKLGWVQPVGADPQKVTENMTAVYGVGAFLLAGTELSKLVEHQ